MNTTAATNVPVSSIGIYSISDTMLRQIKNLCDVTLQSTWSTQKTLKPIKKVYDRFLEIAQQNRYDTTQKNTMNGHPETAEYIALRRLDIFDILWAIWLATSAELSDKDIPKVLMPIQLSAKKVLELISTKESPQK